MAGNPEFNLDAAVERMRRIMLWLAVLGTVVFFVGKGPPWGIGFGVGALISVVSFHYTHRFVMAIGPGGKSKPGAFRSILLGARYLLIFAFVYAMMRLFGLHLLAALCGLMIAAAAALLEILYEFIHGT
ncbi:MAG: ATP synthase subunit I [Bryobacterales bacterium]|nr:ATP synthase subunit I [Bryobacterales bacterium]